jgi:cellulose synthase/poly-beta-1,6-N-acetylglucosamine synthase-like glycosyltransferase
VRLADIAPALPWLLFPLVAAWRVRRTTTLHQFAAEAPPEPPLVSIIVPARNERRNVERCLRSMLTARYPALEVLLVDDHSEDGTGEIARAIAAHDRRLCVLESPPLPPGWFGKQWACATGARAARGDILLFADADTEQAPDLVPRAVNAMRALYADLLSVAGRQELGTFWERLLQPQIFMMLFLRYGGTEGVNRANRPENVIANGQCFLVRRDAYDAIGGHEAVRENVAEDLMLAQATARAGRRVRFVLGPEQLSTRMYTSLRELIEGWGKNIYAGGMHAAPFGAVGRALYPLALLSAPLFFLLPSIVMVLALVGAVPDALLWSGAATAGLVIWWALVYWQLDEPPHYALLYPLGSAMLLYICLRAVLRGRRVQWKGRAYVTR